MEGITVRFSTADTIAAPATPPGKGAMSVIRLTGSNSLEIAERIFKPIGKRSIQVFFPLVGKIFSAEKRFIDNVVMLCFTKPKSYTGEDMVEISCHGSPIITAEIMETLITAGARMAEPGEFSFRAFLNGKMDLIQAESIGQLIEAQTRRQARIAGEQMSGRVSKFVKEIKEKIIQMIAQLETAVEFEEENLEEREIESIASTLEHVLTEVAKLAQSYEAGNIIFQGKKVVIVGRPNVGKSSLFNNLINEERAIVCDIPGTTRDALQETIEVNGIPLQITDTAGWRRTRNRVEQEGVRRSEKALDGADLVLFILDAEIGWHSIEEQLVKKTKKKKVMIIWNKIDLVSQPPKLSRNQEKEHLVCYVSAKTGMGIEECKNKMYSMLTPEYIEEDGPLITNLRHKQNIDKALICLRQAKNAIARRYTEEYIVTDMKKALEYMDEMTGETTTEDILGVIFSRFCIGK